MTKKRCLNCNKWIDLSKDKYVLVKTCNRKKDNKLIPDDESYFHFQCWIDYFNNCVFKKIQNAQAKAMQMFSPLLKNLTSQLNQE